MCNKIIIHNIIMSMYTYVTIYFVLVLSNIISFV